MSEQAPIAPIQRTQHHFVREDYEGSALGADERLAGLVWVNLSRDDCNECRHSGHGQVDTFGEGIEDN